MKKAIIIFIIILALSAGIAGFYHYQKNSYSKETLKIEILGMKEVDLAQKIVYTVKYKNNGNARLENPKLTFECPDNSLKCSIVGEEESEGQGNLLRKTISLLTIYPGEEKTIQIEARLLGSENDTKVARASLTYQPKDLKGYYESVTTFTSVIKKVPITFGIDIPSKIESGKEISILSNYFSHINYPLSNLSVIAEYPSDFNFLEANPLALEKTNWDIGLLNENQGGRIEIKGTLNGEVKEQKIFKIRFGIWQEGEFTLLKEIVKAVEIVSPSLYISQSINNNPKYIADPGELLHYEIFFKNIGEQAQENMFLVVKLEGNAFDYQSIRTDSGNFASGDNSIIFDWRRVPMLRFLDAQEEGKVEFWIELKKEWEMTQSQEDNFIIRNKIYLSQAREEFANKVNSMLNLSQKGYFEDEVFGNSGPIPPKVGQKTTYTIIWQIKNHYNILKNVKVKTLLPQNVEFVGSIFPEQEIEKIAFDPVSREIVWDVGDIENKDGVVLQNRNIAFQISFIPNEAQRGTKPEIIGKGRISGEDEWTGIVVDGFSPAINTTLPDDRTISEEAGIIQ
ncbi:MAG: hypothetical protein U9P88_00260 [Patescibacteria group bacterium]|nr:hypothetical protein [Patescibacteria group bacterium]